MSASWPSGGPVDKTLLRASEYLMNSAHDFRLRIKNQINLALKVNFHFYFNISMVCYYKY